MSLEFLPFVLVLFIRLYLTQAFYGLVTTSPLRYILFVIFFSIIIQDTFPLHFQWLTGAKNNVPYSQLEVVTYFPVVLCFRRSFKVSTELIQAETSLVGDALGACSFC